MGVHRWNEADHPRGRDGKFGAGGIVRVHTRTPDGSVAKTRNGWPARSGGMPPPDDVEMMPAAELRQTLRYGTDGFDYDTEHGWRDVLARQIADPGTPQFMADVALDGIEPIHVTGSMVNDGGREELHRRVRNGNHRLAIAMLMGVRAVPISHRDHETWGEGQNRKVAVELGDPPVTELPEGAAEVIAKAQDLIRRGVRGQYTTTPGYTMRRDDAGRWHPKRYDGEDE